MSSNYYSTVIRILFSIDFSEEDIQELFRESERRYKIKYPDTFNTELKINIGVNQQFLVNINPPVPERWYEIFSSQAGVVNASYKYFCKPHD